MNCREALELLPWLVNETLEPSEEGPLREHLESCEACRAELKETRIALAVAAQHLPLEALLEHAAGRDPGVDPELFETHLASCSACADELALLLESREALIEEPPERGKLLAWRPAAPPTSMRWWRGLAAAAAIVALGASFSAVWSLRKTSRLTERLAGLESPRINVAVVDLYPDELVLRAGESAEPPVRIPAAPATLILNSQLPASSGPFRLEIRAADEKPLVEISGLTPDADGLLTLSLDTATLPSGELVLHLFPPGPEPGEPLESYRFQIR